MVASAHASESVNTTHRRYYMNRFHVKSKAMSTCVCLLRCHVSQARIQASCMQGKALHCTCMVSVTTQRLVTMLKCASEAGVRGTQLTNQEQCVRQHAYLAFRPCCIVSQPLTCTKHVCRSPLTRMKSAITRQLNSNQMKSRHAPTAVCLEHNVSLPCPSAAS